MWPRQENQFLNQTTGFKTLFLLTCSSLIVFFYWTNLQYTPVEATELNTIDYSLKNVNNFLKLGERKKRSINSVQDSTMNGTRDIKYVLFWTKYDMAPFHYFKEGQRSFIEKHCPETNCYVTSNRTFFNDVSKFDAIAFNGRLMNLADVPEKRSRHQKYIFVQMEPADIFPVCDKRYDGFFNWTSTYRLDSEIPYPYFVGKNKQGEVIAPQINKQWPETFPEVDDNLAATLTNKTKAAVWFVSRCRSRSHREDFVANLQEALHVYGYDVDIYGKCGSLKCKRREFRKCNALLKKNYFFYLALENSINDDYVTEKLETALQNDIVPIVLGGTDYSRYIPPGSYIHSKDYNATSLAAYMVQLIRNPDMYKQFFRWKSQYTYSTSTRTENVCAFCAALSNKEKFETETIYDQFRKWWLPNYEIRC